MRRSVDFFARDGAVDRARVPARPHRGVPRRRGPGEARLSVVPLASDRAADGRALERDERSSSAARPSGHEDVKAFARRLSPRWARGARRDPRVPGGRRAGRRPPAGRVRRACRAPRGAARAAAEDRDAPRRPRRGRRQRPGRRRALVLRGGLGARHRGSRRAADDVSPEGPRRAGRPRVPLPAAGRRAVLRPRRRRATRRLPLRSSSSDSSLPRGLDRRDGERGQRGRVEAARRAKPATVREALLHDPVRERRPTTS